MDTETEMSASDQDPAHQHCGTPAIFLDRDGTIMYDTGYPKHPDEVRLMPGVCRSLKQLRHSGYLLVIVSNQSGVGRGIMTIDQAQSVHTRLQERLCDGGASVDGAYYCYDSPRAASVFRKPGIGMLLQAQREFGLCLTRSFMIGDKPSDVEAGNRAGCRTIFFSPAGSAAALPLGADHIAASWAEIVNIVAKYDNQ